MKKGFTLIELLAVISILGLLIVLVAPNVVKNLDFAAQRTLKVQENELIDATTIYIEDYCNHSLEPGLCKYDSSKGKVTETNNGLIRHTTASYNGGSEKDYYFVCLKDLPKKGLHSGIITYESNKNPCVGFITFEKNSKNNHYENGKAYLYCGTEKQDSSGVAIVDETGRVINMARIEYETDELIDYYPFFQDCGYGTE